MVGKDSLGHAIGAEKDFGTYCVGAMISGAFITLVSVVGSCGVKFESKVLLGAYLFFVSILLIAQFSIADLFFTYMVFLKTIAISPSNQVSIPW